MAPGLDFDIRGVDSVNYINGNVVMLVKTVFRSQPVRKLALLSVNLAEQRQVKIMLSMKIPFMCKCRKSLKNKTDL